jgi:hypothetical protein
MGFRALVVVDALGIGPKLLVASADVRALLVAVVVVRADFVI